MLIHFLPTCSEHEWLSVCIFISIYVYHCDVSFGAWRLRMLLNYSIHAPKNYKYMYEIFRWTLFHFRARLSFSLFLFPSHSISSCSFFLHANSQWFWFIITIMIMIIKYKKLMYTLGLRPDEQFHIFHLGKLNDFP